MPHTNPLYYLTAAAHWAHAYITGPNDQTDTLNLYDVSGLAHFELLELLGLSAFGAVLAFMAYKFKRLGPGIFAHGMFNLLAILSVAGILH